MSDIERLLAEVEASPEGAGVGAFFDFDGTLIDGYSAVVYFKDRLKRRDVDARELLHTLVESVNVDRRGHDITDLMTMAVSALAGRSVEDLERISDRLFREKIAGMVFPDARRLVAAHLAKGHTVAIASSATRFQTQLAAADLGIDTVLCTEVGAEDGILTGLLAGPILWGEGKANAVREFAQANDIDLAQSFCYGNGGEDVAFLEVAGNPRPLNPDSRLQEAAAARDWPVASLGTASPDITSVARSVAAYAGMGAGVAIGVGLGLLNRSRTTAANVAASVGGDLSLAAGGVQLQIHGEENLWAARPAVFLFNHQSQLDVMILSALLRRDFTGVAKKQLRKDPVFGPIGYLGGVAYVDRSNTAKAKEALEPVVEALRGGTSIAISPEGTRSPTAELLPFKKGPFHVAMQAGVPVVPVVIRNAGEIMPAHSPWLTPGAVQVAVLPPVPTSTWTVKGLDRRISAVRQMFLDTLEDWPS